MDRRWEWKDENEFEELRARGYFSSDVLAAIERTRTHAVALVERWGPPFGDAWADWRPDPAWSLATLPPDWDAVPPDHQLW
jgi:hypothetical protein